MKIMDLPVELRDKLGSANARRYRRAGHIPVNLYGAGKDNVNLLTSADAFAEVLKEHTALVRLKHGEKAQTALVREVRWNVFGDHVQHIDLARVDMSDEVKIKVPVHTTGIPVGIGHGGGLEIVLREIEVFSRVDSIPSELSIDVTELDVGDGVHVEEVTYPDNVRPAGNPRDLVLHCVAPKKVEEPGEGEDGEAAEGESAEGGEAAAPASDDS